MSRSEIERKGVFSDDSLRVLFMLLTFEIIFSTFTIQKAPKFFDRA